MFVLLLTYVVSLSDIDHHHVAGGICYWSSNRV